ncbi:MAG: rhomboid family intramembrane serine protease [Lactobacillaceae bacterium]|nr:rhomboid family intramembrane serine protease [Lactobacillaceae bacterium]
MRSRSTWSLAPVTIILVVIQVLVYLAMTLAGGSTNPAVLVRFGALQPELLRAGQWWRLITPVFVHIGFTHLLINSLTLYFLGLYIEQLFGHWRMLVIYFVSAIAGNLCSAYWLSGSLAAGASTAIFGLFGAFLMLGESFRDNLAIRQLSRQFLILVLLNVGTDLLVPGIDLAGHIGGLFAGFLMAYVVAAPKIGPVATSKRWLSAVVLVVAILVLILEVS